MATRRLNDFTVSGDVGIGTTSPSAKLHVYGDMILGGDNTDAILRFWEGNNGWNIRHKASDNSMRFSNVLGGTDHITFAETGDVGIGTTSPSAKLDVSGTVAGDVQLKVGNGSTDTSAKATLKLGTAGGNWFIENRRNGGKLVFVEGSSDVVTMDGGNVSIGTSTPFTTGGTAKLTVASNVISFGASNSDMSYFRRTSTGNFQWQTYNNGNTGNIHLQPYGGNIGIGTTSPSTKLHIKDTGEAVARIEDADGTNQYVELAHNNGASYIVSRNNTSHGSFKIYTSNGTATTERMCITSSGDLQFADSISLNPASDKDKTLDFGIDGKTWSNITLDANHFYFKRDGSIKGTYDLANNRLGLGTTSPAVALDISTTDAVQLPVGTTAQRPTAAAGMIRYNSTDGSFEGYTSEWGAIGGGDDFSLKSITKNASNQFPITFADSTNFKLSASGTWTITATIASGDVGKSGIILIQNTAATTPGALPSTFKTPNGDNIVWETDSGDYSVLSYFIASTTHVLVNYVGNFS